MTHFESVPATHSNQWLVLTDNEGLVVHASEAFCNAAGHPPEQLLGQPIAILRHPDMPKGPIADLWETLGRGESWMGMLKNRRADGSDFWVDAYISPIQAADGQVLEYQAIYRDPDPEIIRRTQRVYRIRSQGRQPSELRWPRLSAPMLQTLLASLAFLPLAVLAFRQAPLTAGLLFLLGIVLSGCALCWHGRALARLVNHCRSLVSHPIKQLIYTGRTDAVGQIELAMRLLRVRLEVMVARIHDSSQQVAGHVAQVSDLLDLSSTASLGQQSALQAIAAAVEEFTATIREVAANTHTAAELGSSNREYGDLGLQRTQAAQQSIQVLAGELQQSALTVAHLNHDSQAIGRILDVIHSIAEQTNLLALNAAIEAARAGDNGRGFAVVADEVRSLAQRTQASTDEIQQLISALQQGTGKVVQAIEQGVQQSRQSVDHINASAEALDGIALSIGRSDQLNRQIAAASDQQNQAAADISQQIHAIHTLASDTSLQLQQTLRAAESVSAQMLRQQALISLLRRH